MDNRDMNELHVNWQFVVLLISLILMPLLCIPLGGALLKHETIRKGVIEFTVIEILTFGTAIFAAIYSRIRQARWEIRPDGSEMPAWILRQVCLAVILLAVSAGIIALVSLTGLPHQLCAYAGLPAFAPAVMMMARAMIPVDRPHNRGRFTSRPIQRGFEVVTNDDPEKADSREDLLI